MIRQIITIDEDKCNGCGICVDACHEGAIAMVDGKAKLIRDDYCDGLGDCLPTCPTGAISFETREAAPFDEEAVKARIEAREKGKDTIEDLPCGCPGTLSRILKEPSSPQTPAAEERPGSNASKLRQWPVQIKLVPVNAPYFNNANLLIAADCAAFAHGNFHNEFMRNKITLIGCPKLDSGDYAEKLAAIIKENNIKSVTVARMEVPCCGGLEHAVKRALIESGKMIPWQIVTISTDGNVLDQ